jgi:glycerate kinase
MGMAAALGVIFYDLSGNVLNPCGGNLQHIHRIDYTTLHPKLSSVSITLLCDVANPLYGPQGAAHVYAPQKGATPFMVQTLDDGLKNFEQQMIHAFRKPVNFPGAGAGGGLPAMLCALSNVKICRGIDFMMTFTDLESKIQQADLVITGEGKLDDQTLSGKVVQGVSALALKYRWQVVAFVGTCALAESQWKDLGIDHVITLANETISTKEAMQHAGAVLQKRVGQYFSDFEIKGG